MGVAIRWRRLFAVLVAAEIAHAGVAIWQHRAPSGHDGFQFFTLHYYFLNNAIQSGDVAQWIPYMNHGTIATLWYGVQASMLQQVLLVAAPWLRHADLLTLFHLSMFVDTMVLLAGTWLVARRFFGAPAAFFVTASVVGSCVWLDQPYWNFRLYYALPLVLEMGHRFLDSGCWRWVALALNLLALQTLGNLPYAIPVASFVVFAYFAWYWTSSAGLVAAALRRVHWGVPALAAVACGGASLAASYYVLTIGTHPLISYNPGRLADGTTDLAGFLTYGGSTDLLKWVDTLLNLSPWFDFTLYAGILLLPLVVVGLFAVDRRRLHFVLVALTLLLFTLATPVSVALYHAWPAMKYFRHIGLVSPLVKVLLCFVAALGFELLFDPPAGTSVRRIRVAAAAGVLVFAASALLIVRLVAAGPGLDQFVDRLSDPGVDRPPHTYQHSALSARLVTSLGLVVLGAGVIGLVPVFSGSRILSGRPRVRSVLVYAVLGLVAADVYHFKFAHLFDRSDAIRPAGSAAVQPSPMTFPVQREQDLQRALTTSPRLQQTLYFNTVLLQRIQGGFAPGAKYWTNNAFFFVDEVGSSFRVDSWLAPLNQLMRVYTGEPLDDATTAPPSLGAERFDFPLGHPSAASVTGITAGKVRFFNNAYRVASADQLAPLMADPDFRGNLLFVLASDSVAGADEWKGLVRLSADESHAASFQVQRFDANHLVMRVNNPSPAGVWMSYADVWHPSWRATLNGRSVPVQRAQMAYKAVRLEPGENIVSFEFGSRRFSALAALFAANAALWLGLVAWLVWEILRRASSARGEAGFFARPYVSQLSQTSSGSVQEECAERDPLGR